MNESTIDLPVLGMTCAACVRRVERAVGAVPGVTRADVNLLQSRARVVLDPDVATLAGAALPGDLRDAGYEVPADALDLIGRQPGGGASRLAAIERAAPSTTRSRDLRRSADDLAVALTAPPLVALRDGGEARHAPRAVIAQLVLGTIVVLGPGRRYLRGGALAIRHRSPDMNTLIALGAGAAWLSSTILAMRWLAGPRDGAPELYFEAGAAIVAFVMIGKLLESRARARLSEADP